MRRGITKQDKVNVLTMLYSGMSKNSLSRLTGIDKREITIWQLRFKRGGVDGLEQLRRKVLTKEQKYEIVRQYLAGNCTMREVVAEHNICLSSLKNWMRQYREEMGEIKEVSGS